VINSNRLNQRFIKNPVALELMRDVNFLASLVLYGMCGLIWYYRGSLKEMLVEVKNLRFADN